MTEIIDRLKEAFERIDELEKNHKEDIFENRKRRDDRRKEDGKLLKSAEEYFTEHEKREIRLFTEARERILQPLVTETILRTALEMLTDGTENGKSAKLYKKEK